MTRLLRLAENPLDPAIAAEEARHCRESVPEFARWAAGYGPIEHSDLTQWRLYRAVDRLGRAGISGDGANPWRLLHAADRLAAAGMWLAAHQVYARNVRLDGRALESDDFKADPEGHLGGSLNMAIAYTGYLAANALTGDTRAWLMGQGHCVGGVDSVNVLVGNLSPAHASRYDVSDAGLSRFARDFYSYALDARGRPVSPSGSHVNAHTAGGISEGGYLGFAELQYVHMPLPGERLVAFLSDGAFEEQRGSDWASRWWRPADSGLVCPIMISNGRRIDQRSTMSQSGGADWFVDHLRLNGFDPIVFDGRDPAAFVWAILEMERREKAAARVWRENPEPPWTTPLPYGVAVTQKGFGFVGAGSQRAHNTPLPGIPRVDAASAQLFNESARALWVPPAELAEAVALLSRHSGTGRPRERDHALATRKVDLDETPAARAQPVSATRADPETLSRSSPMTAVDDAFVAIVERNPGLRPRVGNPDEMSSNRLVRTLAKLRFRVAEPEPGVPEDVMGAVITALNEEAVVSAALGNKGGINLVHTYEAFGPKMLGVLRQELDLHRRAARGGPAGRLALRSAPADLAHLGERQERAIAPGPRALRGDARRALAPLARALSARRELRRRADGAGLPQPRAALGDGDTEARRCRPVHGRGGARARARRCRGARVGGRPARAGRRAARGDRRVSARSRLARFATAGGTRRRPSRALRARARAVCARRARSARLRTPHRRAASPSSSRTARRTAFS